MENKNMNELKKMIVAVKGAGLKHEIVEDGMVVHLNNCVLVTAYWDWSDLLTNIYMSEAVYRQLLDDIKKANADGNKLSLPVFAFTYGYGLTDNEVGYGWWNVTPFYDKCIDDDYIAKLMKWDGDRIEFVGNPNNSDIIYYVANGYEDDYSRCGVFNDFFKAHDALRKSAENKPSMKNLRPSEKYRLEVSRINFLYDDFEDDIEDEDDECYED